MYDGGGGPSDSVLTRWFRFETGRMNGGVAAESRSLAELLEDPAPSVRTRDGGRLILDRSVLQDFSHRLPPGMGHRLRLPVLFYQDINQPASCELRSDAALEAFQALGEISSLYQMDKGTVFLSTPLARNLERRYPTLVQVMFR